ncbi:MAG: hypothetical protein ABI266_01385, partial [Ginsengibacter sp.]
MHTSKCYLFFLFLLVTIQPVFSQYDVPLYTSYTTVQARTKTHDLIIKNTITRNLSMPLADSTESNWEDAFNAMEVFNYQSPFTFTKVRLAFDSIQIRSIDFQRSLIELAYTLYPKDFIPEAKSLLEKSINPKVFAMSGEYMIRQDRDSGTIQPIFRMLFEKFSDSVYKDPILNSLLHRLRPDNVNISKKELLASLLNKSFLPGKIVMYSFQRKNRDYPGMVIIRNAQGQIITDDKGVIFTVPQLARSISNLPYYLTNGNTPQGIYRMYG